MQGLTFDLQKQKEIPAGGDSAPDVTGVWFSKAAIFELAYRCFCGGASHSMLSGVLLF